MVCQLAQAQDGSRGWQLYTNPRFGSTADIPVGWRPGEEPANGDGLVFTSPDGTAEVIVSGSLHVFDSIGEAMRIYEQPQDGETITYKARGKRFLVVSGTKGDRIFYAKHILSCHDQVWNQVYIEYPASRKRAFDALVTHIAGSLRAGPSAQVAECP